MSAGRRRPALPRQRWRTPHARQFRRCAVSARGELSVGPAKPRYRRRRNDLGVLQEISLDVFEAREWIAAQKKRMTTRLIAIRKVSDSVTAAVTRGPMRASSRRSTFRPSAAIETMVSTAATEAIGAVAACGIRPADLKPARTRKAGTNQGTQVSALPNPLR